jgi:taurine transport system substrate-binding protein
MTRAIRFLTALLAVVCWMAGGALAAEKEVTIGFQRIYNPFKVVIADRILEKTTGYAINWRVFESGSEVVDAMAAGEVDIALAGSSPIASGVSRGVDMALFWIAEDIGSAEALVVRDGSGIVSPQDLRGKRIAVPFVSTGHFHLLFALEQFGISPTQIQLLNMPPTSIAAAWEKGSIDAAFVWDPALGRLKKTGRVLITSGVLSSWGKATFDGMVVRREWARDHDAFMVEFVRAIAAADEDYRANKEMWTPESDPVKKIVKVAGGDPADVPGVLAQYNFPTLEEQASDLWLGGGAAGGAARALFHTSSFLRDEKKIDRALFDYSLAVEPRWVVKVLGE